MDASCSEATTKPALSSTKSIDEGFESDPDREQSNTETEPNNNNNTNNLPLIATPTTKSPLLIASSQRSRSFDVLQRTDRDGVQHTQITHRPRINEIFENDNLIRNDNLNAGRIIYPNPKVSIPRAGASNLTNHQMIVSSSGGNGNGNANANHYISTLNSKPNKTNTIIDSNQRHRLDGESIELTGSRLAQSTELMLRSGREWMNSSNSINNNNPSQIALINGKLICINMPATQQLVQTSSISSNPKTNNNNSASSMAIASLNHYHNNMNRHINSNSNVINHATNHNMSYHHQKYINNGRNHNRGINDSMLTTITTTQPTNASIAQQVNKNIIQNANSSIYTFYPAEGNISLIPSQYGLKYKSTHLNGLQDQPAPIMPWSQSMARHPKRYELLLLFGYFINSINGRGKKNDLFKI